MSDLAYLIAACELGKTENNDEKERKITSDDPLMREIWIKSEKRKKS